MLLLSSGTANAAPSGFRESPRGVETGDYVAGVPSDSGPSNVADLHSNAPYATLPEPLDTPAADKEEPSPMSGKDAVPVGDTKEYPYIKIWNFHRGTFTLK